MYISLYIYVYVYLEDKGLKFICKAFVCNILRTEKSFQNLIKSNGIRFYLPFSD